MSERRCKARDDAGFWWGKDVIDSSEPGFVKGRGVFIPETKPCPYVPLPEVDLCYRHSFLADNHAVDKPEATDSRRRSR